MKVLFFLYGEYRTFPTAIKTWNILDIPNLDIVIHTPPSTSEYFESGDIKSITKEHFSILGNPQVFFYDRYEYQKTDLHVLHYSYRFLSKYLKEFPEKQYDYIFIGRLDSTFYLENYTEFFNEKRNEIFAISPPYISTEATFIPDHTFFGTYEVIKKFVDNLPDGEFLQNSHGDMAHYVKNNFETLEWKYPFDCTHVRPNMVSYYENHFKKYGKIKEKDENYLSFLETEFFKNYYTNLELEYKRQYCKV